MLKLHFLFSWVLNNVLFISSYLYFTLLIHMIIENFHYLKLVILNFRSPTDYL